MRAARREVWVWLVLLCAVLAKAHAAHAVDTDRIERLMQVKPGATCLTANKLALEVEPLLDDVRVPSDFMFLVEGSASDPRNARLRILRHGQPVAERAFDPGPERCSHLHAAVGLAIALAINAAREEETQRAPQWSFSGSVLWTYGFVPQLAPGLELLVSRRLSEHVLIRLGPVGILAFDASLGSPRGTFDAVLAAARAEGCMRTRLARVLRAGGCAGMLGGALYVSGKDFTGASRSTVPWLALAAGASLELELSQRWALVLGLSASFLLHHVAVGIEDASGARLESRELDRLAFALGVGPMYSF